MLFFNKNVLVALENILTIRSKNVYKISFYKDCKYTLFNSSFSLKQIISQCLLKASVINMATQYMNAIAALCHSPAKAPMWNTTTHLLIRIMCSWRLCINTRVVFILVFVLNNLRQYLCSKPDLTQRNITQHWSVLELLWYEWYYH
jgi:hypothetical protein